MIDSNEDDPPTLETRVELHGELDLAAQPWLEQALAEARATEAPSIVLDCRRLDFLDCSALGAVARHRQLAPAVSIAFRSPSPFVARILGLVGWADLIERD